MYIASLARWDTQLSMLQRLGGSRAVRKGFDTLSFESCSSSMACDMEEVSSESSRKMEDKEETTSEASWTAVTRGKGKGDVEARTRG